MKRLLFTLIVSVSLLSLVPLRASANEFKYREYVEEIAQEYGINPYIIYALIERESKGNPNATSDDGTCKGLCQVNPKWHKDRMKRLGVVDIYEPRGNILVAVDYLMEISNGGEVDIDTCLMVYNEGNRGYKRSSKGIVSDYAVDITERAIQLEEKDKKGQG